MSVIVPVFNPGAAFDELMTSLDEQTLPPEQFEVILCDDGSDAPTAARLSHVARDRPNVRVLSLPHSGWPGTPRNHGIVAAQGTYVYFVDQDDRLFARALERLCDYADAHASDVVVGREVGIGRTLPRQIFRRDIPRAVLGEDPLLELLTPHKLFRTSFLKANGIRFPDGRVRLEDHLFVMQAYFQAETISILSSEPCYAWVKRAGSASSSRIDPDTYFPHLETVLDLVEHHTEPGEARDRLLRHWYRGKILKRLAGRRMLAYPDEYRDRFIDVVRPLIQRRFGPGVDDGLAFSHRIRSALLRAGRRDDLVRFAAFETELECRAEITAARWSRGGGLRLTVRTRITHDGEDALAFAPGAGSEHPRWQPPSWLADLPAHVRGAAGDLAGDRVEVLLRESPDAPPRRLAQRRGFPAGAVALAVDPVRAFSREDPSRGGELLATVQRAGWTFRVPLTAAPEVIAAAGRSPFLAGRRCTLESNEDDTVVLRRAWPAGRIRDAAARAARRVRALVRRAGGPR